MSSLYDFKALPKSEERPEANAAVVEPELQIKQLAVCSVFSLVRGAVFFPIMWMIQLEDVFIYWARNSIARGERNGKLKDKSRQTRR
jgi:hypothetical protein